MQLTDYLREKGMTIAGFTRLAGLPSRQITHKYVHGQRFPTPENLLRIRLATHGEVTADDFVDQHVSISAERDGASR